MATALPEPGDGWSRLQARRGAWSRRTIRIETTIIMTMPTAIELPSPGLWSASPLICAPIMMPTILRVPPVSAYAVAYAPKALPNSSTIVPENRGQ